MASVDVGNPIVSGEAFVDEGVIRGQQIADTSIVSELPLEKELRLSTKGISKVVIELRKLVHIRRELLQVSQVQPLGSETIHQGTRSAIREHALDLALEDLRI